MHIPRETKQLPGATQHKVGDLSPADVDLLRTVRDKMRAARQTDEERALAEFAHEMQCMVRDMKMERLLSQMGQW